MLMKLFIALLIILAAWQIIDPEFRLSSEEVIVRKTLPMDVTYETIEAESYLNSIRKKMNMLTLSHNESLKDAAKAHAYYLVSNNENTHEEIVGHKNFVATKPVERAFKMGYNSGQVSENLSTSNNNAHQSVDGLFSAIYHRFGFLSMGIDEVGVGVAQDEYNSGNSAFVYVMGNSDINRLCAGKSYTGSGVYWKSCKNPSQRIREEDFIEAMNYGKQNNPNLVLYPYDGQKEIPPAFYSEIPDPLPSYDVSGFPISVEFNDFYYKKVTLLSFSLYDFRGDAVESYLMDKANDPHQRFTEYQFAIFPLKRLEYNTRYRAEIVYRIKDEIKKHVWYFHTKYITEKFYIVEKLYDNLSIIPKKSYVIYFRPVDAHDVMTDIEFPQDVDVQFLDNNTIKLTLMSDELDEFLIKTGTKQLRITVEH